MLTERRSIDHLRKQLRAQDHVHIVEQSAAQAIQSDGRLEPLGMVPDAEPTPLMATLLVEAFRERLRALDNHTLQAIALAKLNGNSNQEIAEQLGLGLRSVERKLGLIRSIWQRNSDDE